MMTQERESEHYDQGVQGTAWSAEQEVRRLRAQLNRAESELDDYRTGLAAGFGTYTASPHETLVNLGIAHEHHHREHHAREAALKHVLRDAITRLDRGRFPDSSWRKRALQAIDQAK